MAQGNLELVFYGQLAQGVALQQAKENVALLFKASTEQVERMFTGQRVVIRNKLDAEMAQKYLIAMQKRGAICQLEAMGQPGVKVELNSAEPAADQTPETMAPAHTATPPVAPGPAAPAPSRPEIEAKRQSTNPGGLPLAGDKTDAILAATHFELDPVGVRLSEEQDVVPPEFPHIDELTVAPAGSDLSDNKEQPPTAVPDISHLSLEP